MDGSTAYNHVKTTGQLACAEDNDRTGLGLSVSRETMTEPIDDGSPGGETAGKVQPLPPQTGADGVDCRQDIPAQRWPRYYVTDLLAITLGFALSLALWQWYDGILLGHGIIKSCLPLVGMAIVFERWIQLNRIRSANQKVWNQLHPVLVKGEFDKARKIINKDKSNLAQMLGMGLARQGAVRRRDDIEIAMEESMMEIIPQLEKRTPYVALLSNIATLLGLLGTIMGLIAAFTAVANANPAEKADLLSASISVAMNTTAFGLMSAIPLLLFHAKLTSTTGQIVDSLEMASVKTLNTISNFAKREFDRS